MRAVAARAGVDVALIYHHFGSKDDLLASALSAPAAAERRRRAIPAGTPEPGGALVRAVLEMWEHDPDLRRQALAMFRTAISHDLAAQRLQSLHGEYVLDLISEIVAPDERELRAGLIGTQLHGLLTGRYLLCVPSLTTPALGTIVRRAGMVLGARAILDTRLFLKDPGVAMRRHGEALERALLDAAWDELAEGGYAAFTMDAVAVRAGTSRPVLYRRWPDKHDLVRAAVAHALDREVIAVPDTGSLRGDVITLMKNANETRADLVAAVTVHLGGYYRETGSSPDDLRQMLASGRPRVLDTVLERAEARGEIRRDQVSERVMSLPFALLTLELVMTLRPVPASVIDDIVDTIFLPLVTAQ